MKLEIIFENIDLVTVNKPAGILVHGIYDKYGPKHNEVTLADMVAKKYPEILDVGDPGAILEFEGEKVNTRPGVIHRLDRETSGVIVFGRNQETFDYLKSLFKASSEGESAKVSKTYQALVWGRVKNQRGLINKPISINNGTVKRTTGSGRMPREAITEYEVRGRYQAEGKDFTLLNAMPKTGRTHQIRVHLNSIGHSVYGDKIYGQKPDILNLGRQFLHAASLELAQKGSTVLTLTAPLPKELKALIKKLSLES